jgi:hypothetical protein
MPDKNLFKLLTRKCPNLLRSPRGQFLRFREKPLWLGGEEFLFRMAERNSSDLGLRDVEFLSHSSSSFRKVRSFGFKEALSFSVSKNPVVALLVLYSVIYLIFWW